MKDDWAPSSCIKLVTSVSCRARDERAVSPTCFCYGISLWNSVRPLHIDKPPSCFTIRLSTKGWAESNIFAISREVSLGRLVYQSGLLRMSDEQLSHIRVDKYRTYASCTKRHSVHLMVRLSSAEHYHQNAVTHDTRTNTHKHNTRGRRTVQSPLEHSTAIGHSLLVAGLEWQQWTHLTFTTAFSPSPRTGYTPLQNLPSMQTYHQLLCSVI